jgi:heme ABC exporter ATP-binding subunit CcmA
VISAVGLRKAFGRQLALDAVSLEVGAGECVAILGPNGAGKTTLLRILATALRPSAGSLYVGGVDALRDPDAARALLRLVAHGSHLYEELTALENLRFWSAMLAVPGASSPDARAPRAALAEVGLDAVADERVRTFSAGMKRRLALARGLLGEARALVLDEPASGLDRQGRAWLGEFLARFTARGGAVVMATHGFEGALEVAARVVVLARGRVVLDRPALALSADGLRQAYDEAVAAELVQ